MHPVDYILIVVLVLLLGTVVWFIRRSRKKGRKCIGCPDSGGCSGQCPGCSIAKEK